MLNTSAIGLAFLEGIGLIVSPCILPILPIVLSTSLTDQPSRPYGIILGFIITFTTLTLSSRFLVQAVHLDPTLLRQIAFVVLLLVGIFMMSERLSGFFAEKTAGFGQAGSQLQTRVKAGNGFISGLLVGACIGAVWVPCSGPILAAVLVQSIQQKSDLSSTLTLLAFSLGTGLPMLGIAIGGKKVMTRLNWFKQHGGLVRKVIGAIIIGVVIYTSQDVWNVPAQLGLGHNSAAYAEATLSARLTDGLAKPYPAPAFTGIKQWFNSPPITMASLKGKVVLVDFWTYSCINCLRTLPHITAWDAKYRKAGLVIVGVHAPEFEFERNPANVAKALKQYNIKYPVALDSDLQTWSQFNNQYWPAHYLIDRSGQVVYTHFGEGHYDITEKNIQTLLGKTSAIGRDAAVPVGLGQTPETYLGMARARNYAGKEPVSPSRTQQYQFPDSLDLNNWALSGAWSASAESLQAEQANASLQLHFLAKKVFLVLGTKNGQTVPTQIYLNGKPSGAPIMVKDHRLYTLLSLPGVQNGRVTIKALKPGLQAYAFTFES